MNYKRITLLSGHYGSGKTNIAVNMATEIARQAAAEQAGADAQAGAAQAAPDKSLCMLADLDIVNPYFRSADSEEMLSLLGVELIVSPFANTNLDVPALPQEMYKIVDDKSRKAIIDVGGDERGALALGRISDGIREEGNYDMFLVINKYRPLTPDADSVAEIAAEIEEAGHLAFTGIINCSNLGAETDADTVLSSVAFAQEVSKKLGLPIVATAVEAELYEELKGKIEDLFPLNLQIRPV